MCTRKEKEKSYLCLISVLWCFDVKPTRGWCLDEQRGCRIPHRISRLSFSTKRSRCLRTNLDLVQDSTWIQRSPVNPLCLCLHFKKVDSGSTSLYHNCCSGHSIWTPKQKANVWLQAFCLLHLYLTVCGLFGLVLGLTTREHSHSTMLEVMQQVPDLFCLISWNNVANMHTQLLGLSCCLV